MNNFKVKSLPIKEVLQNLGDQMNTPVLVDCDYYEINIPKKFGKGKISGINFPNGLAWLRYECKFWRDTILEFTVNKVHPLKLLYNLSEPINHKFQNDSTVHVAERYQNLILSSAQKNGHVLQFSSGKSIILNSIEIDRAIFKKQWLCDLNDIESDLRAPIIDENAQQEFFFKGSYTLKIADAFHFINTLDQEKFLRKMFLASKTYEVLAQQMLDLSTSGNHQLTHKEIELLQRAEQIVHEDFNKYKTIKNIAKSLDIRVSKLELLVNKKFNLSGNKFIAKVRMEKIADLLENSNLPIQDIAAIVGIESKSYLSKIFKSKYNMSPNEFRKVLFNKNINK